MSAFYLKPFSLCVVTATRPATGQKQTIGQVDDKPAVVLFKPLKWKCAATCQKDEAPTEPSPAYRTTAGWIAECRYSRQKQRSLRQKQQLQRSELKPEASSHDSGLIRGSKDGWMLF